MPELKDKLISKVKILSDTIWDGRATNEEVLAWLDNFTTDEDDSSSEPEVSPRI